MLHGGPGASSDYLIPLEKLASDRPVIFYDQLGCGRSEKPNDTPLWKISRFVSEIETIRKQLILTKFIYRAFIGCFVCYGIYGDQIGLAFRSN